MKPLLLAVLLLLSPWCRGDVTDRAEARGFIQHMVKRHGFERSELEQLFRSVEIQDKVLEAISKPYEAKPWHLYRKLFITEARIQGGVNFWNSNAAALIDAQRRYGVAPEIIVAIIGIETSYGQNTGNYRVIDALATLAFAYPKRAEFFRKELENFLLLSRQENLDPLAPKGSYAGAMGLPQFMPSSYRAFATDFDGDRKRNIWSNPADAIGSVANYFSRNGWASGGAVAYPAAVPKQGYDHLLSKDSMPQHSIARLAGLGVHPLEGAPAADTRANLLELEGETGPEFWLTLQNFYAITRYNHSPLYAMAAHQLSREVLARRNGGTPR
ncbi:MAG: lytic murein transglycosylase B [Methylococcaceae bacterium]|nr:lytic murein transglycosylase B [Methylococcaceae bacterium]